MNNNKLNFFDLILFLKNNNLNINSYNYINTPLYGVNTISDATKNEVIFINDLKYLNKLKITKASFCFIKNDFIDYLPQNCKPLITNDPYLAFALTTNFFNPKPISNGNISNKSYISNDVKIYENVEIGNFSNIYSNTTIGKNTIIKDNVNIGPNVTIGDNNYIESGVSIYNSNIGNNCFIQSGVVIGNSGFGFTPNKKIEIKHSGIVIIKNNVSIGSNTTIDRGTIQSTFIGNNVKIDNLVQIAHNVYIDDGTFIAAQTGIAGSSKVGKNCKIGGQTGISGHIQIGDNVTIAGKSGVTKNIEDGKTIAGFPAVEIKKWKTQLW